MEYEQEYERKYAISTLLRQVKEQNKDFCDVHVQVGTWVERFHSCILVESGFFDKLFHTSKFLEHVTGVIEIRERKSYVVHEAILFLYNVDPVLDKDNIGEFIDIAEFLIIPRLRAFCVKWLEQTKKTNALIEICLPLCTLYDVDVPSVSDYIRMNLIELMNGTELLSIDSNSLHDILSDQYLSYVTMETKFNFLMRWVKVDSLNRSQYFKPLYELVDFLRLSQATITLANQDPLICSTEMVSKLEYEQQHSEPKEFIAMIAEYQDLGIEKEMFMIYDEHKTEWFRLNINMTTTRSSKYFTNRNDKSTFYRVREDSSNDTVIELCSSDGNIVAHSRVTVESYENKATNCNKGIFESICINGSTCVATRTDTLHVETRVASSDYDLEYHQLHDEPLNLTVSCSIDDIQVMQLLIGHIETSSDTTILYPIFSMKLIDDDSLTDIGCLNSNGDVAMLIPSYFSTSVFIYNICSCSLTQIEIDEVSPESKIYGLQNGFAIADELDITLVRHIQDSNDVKHFEAVPALNFELSSDSLMFSIDNAIYRYQYHSCVENYRLDMAAIEEILQTRTCDPINWRQLTSPELKVECIKSVIVLELPNNIDRCHLHCPHCEQLPRGRKRKYFEMCECTFPNFQIYQSQMFFNEQIDSESDSITDGDESD
ncbi:uncharacterized protein LOC128243568 [Mya arenaria]|uniref:uncharacterized protein LOC128243568 n=1 Tax=Mya arenaria TaxID=6604 RepID=UPI0022E1E9AD|nr:uncharacterized protein LOC128243568 [Mya arenaria]